MGNCNFSSKDEDTEEILSAKAFAVTQLNEIAIFSRLKEEDLTEIVETIYHPDEDIVVQGDEHTDLIYVLRNGVCDVKIDGRVVNTLKRASVIGERAFIAQKSRSATVTATEQCSVLAIQRSSLEKALGFDTFNAAEMSEEEIKLEKVKRLSQFPLLTMLSEDYLHSLAESMMIKQYLPGDPIILKGTIGTEFYFIDRGSVDVVADKQSFSEPSCVSPESQLSPSNVNLSLSSYAGGESSRSIPLGEVTPDKVAARSAGVQASPEGEENCGNKRSFSTSGGKGGCDLSKPIEGKPSPLQGVPLVRFTEEGDSDASTDSIRASSPMHQNLAVDTAAAINAGVNDLLENYENARIKNLGGVIRDLKRNTVGANNKRGRTPPKHRKSISINTDDVKATLRAGQFFGEMALMEGGDGRRTATCVARTHTTILAMKKDSFERLMEILSGG
jgi:CRP-like cAMP-binding protein